MPDLRVRHACALITSMLLVSACGGGGSDSEFDPNSRDKASLAQFAVLSKYKIEERLREPSSAVYRSVKVYQHPKSDGGVVFCGEVNARNGFGGMAGYERFVATPTHAVLENMGPTEFQSGWDNFCAASRFIQAAAWF